jgi:putative transcriptional regulator
MLNHVKQTRKMMGLTQKELAELASVGRVTISNIETERYIPGVDTALKIARALERTVEELFILEQDKEEHGGGHGDKISY